MPSYDINRHDASDKHVAPSLRTKEQGGVSLVTGERTHVLDGADYQLRFKKLQQWRRQARVAQADNRTEMAIDEDFYDGIQMDAEDLIILADRSQAPVVFNVIKNALNWVIGTEKKSRVDWRVLPRKKTNSADAKVKTKVMKYVSDVNKVEYARSEAFIEAACSGIGWLECGARNTDEVLFVRSERWRNMWFDHLGTALDGSDMRYVFREKWVDLDIVECMFPERKNELKVLSEGVNSLYPYHPDDTVITDNASEFDLESDLDSLFGGPFDGMRERLKVVEMNYKMPQIVPIMKLRDPDTPYGSLDGAIYRPEYPDHQYLVKGKYFTVSDAMRLVVRCAMWAGRTLLQDTISPYNHNKFAFVPIFCYRRKRDNMPYGIIRDLRDPQSDLNKRRSKALFLLSANQVVVEKGAVDDIADFHSELQKPDGIGVVNEGKMNMWRQIEHTKQVGEHAQMAQDDERFIHSISGVTNDSEWMAKRELSGKAINLMQNQGMTAHGVIFDNYFFAHQTMGEMLLSLMEQFYDQQKEIRITGDQYKDEFVEINKMNDDGTIQNSITSSKADFIVGKQDYRETIRIAMLEQFIELVNTVGKVSPEVSLALLDLVVELMDDLPNKDEAVARIRKINKQHAPEDEMSQEEKMKQYQQDMQAAQEMQAMKQLQQALLQIQVSEGQSKVAKNKAEAAMKKLEGFLKALEAAGTVDMAPHLVEAADTIVTEAQNITNSTEGGQ
jgi:hypothetical protein